MYTINFKSNKKRSNYSLNELLLNNKKGYERNNEPLLHFEDRIIEESKDYINNKRNIYQ